MSLIQSIQSLRSAGPAELRASWAVLARFPGGKRAFSRLIGALAPYTGTVSPEVLELSEGVCRVALRDSRRVRNHLRSVHAVALVNLGELAGNLALASVLPADARFIPVGLSIDYLKKARGTITAECRAPEVTTSERKEYVLQIPIRNAEGETVASMQLRTLVGPRR